MYHAYSTLNVVIIYGHITVLVVTEYICPQYVLVRVGPFMTSTNEARPHVLMTSHHFQSLEATIHSSKWLQTNTKWVTTRYLSAI